MRRSIIASVSAVTLAAAGTTAAFALSDGNDKVGHNNGHGILLPTNQRITPLGHRLLVNNGRLLSSSISPNGRYLAALTWNNFVGFLTVTDLRTGKVVQQVGTGKGSDAVIGDGTVGADGPLWSKDGKSLWFPQSADLLRFTVATNGTVSAPVVIPLQTSVNNLTTGRTTVPDLPSGMALSADGRDLYVALNGVNKVADIRTGSNTVARMFNVGNAPRQIVLYGHRAFVSNEGGRRARPGDNTNNSYGTSIVANKSTGAATTGTVTELDIAAAKQLRQIKVGLQPTAEYVAPDGMLMVANSNDDSFSIINPSTGKVMQTVNVNPLPGATVGSNPNAIVMPNRHTILVSIGRDNALAEFRYSGPAKPVKYVGLLPTDFYPVAVQYDAALKRIVVTNDKGIGARGPDSTIVENGGGTTPAPSSVVGHNTYDDTGTITSFTLPSTSALAKTTHQVFVNNHWDKLLSSKRITHSTAKPVAVPVHLGDPSTIKHVFLIIKENRTYDQVLGDVGKGNSDPSLAQFGATVTPNQHKLATTFPLMDNFYDEGTLSADGHNWLMQADANDYIEREFGAFYRSYPAQGGDALAYQRDGFLWNAAQRAGRTVRAYGEYNNFVTEPAPVPTWQQFYQTSRILEGKASGAPPVSVSSTYTYSDIPSLNAIDDHAYPAFDMGIPDQYRVDVWQQDFARYVKSGKLPNLNLVWLTDDHTAGVGTGVPAPVAEVADNDLAVGRMVNTISHSKYWKNSAVFVLEDDTQFGADHVDGHRGPLLIASPYAKRGALVDTYYTQLNLVRTIEQILGIAPMNQEDRAATPMTDVFTNVSNRKPYTTVPNKVSLSYGLTATPPPPPAPSAASKPDLPGSSSRVAPGSRIYRAATAKELKVPVSERGIYDKWVAWSRGSRLSGARAMVDWANPAQLNRLDWYSAHAWTTPYPGDARILAPDEVPGRNLPNGYLGN